MAASWFVPVNSVNGVNEGYRNDKELTTDTICYKIDRISETASMRLDADTEVLKA